MSQHLCYVSLAHSRCSARAASLSVLLLREALCPTETQFILGDQEGLSPKPQLAGVTGRMEALCSPSNELCDLVSRMAGRQEERGHEIKSQTLLEKKILSKNKVK